MAKAAAAPTQALTFVLFRGTATHVSYFACLLNFLAHGSKQAMQASALDSGRWSDDRKTFFYFIFFLQFDLFLLLSPLLFNYAQ